MTYPEISNAKLEETVVSIIIDELKDHFGGGFSEERIIRETEA